jgi:predicted ATPase/signal transduction histidine kinase
MTLTANSTHSEIHKVPSIPGYRIIEPIYTSSRTVVYRAVHEAQQQPVVIKVLRQAYPSFKDILQFRNQYTITKNLTIAGLVRPLSLETCQNGYALVMEDCGSISLAQYAQHQPLALTTVLNIALQLADILQDLHTGLVIHKDIKPANILIHPKTQQIKLIDFSIASLLPKETQELQNPNVLEGTLAYLAPEQTGRMNRGIDYRADFYSLGVTLYELLTGTLPFPSHDPLELVHCHIAKLPVSPHQLHGTIPPILSAILLKLMAKNAEDRYQSALGLKYDLQQCWQQWQETGNITPFQLGQRDICDRFIIPEKLYGRDAEVSTLLQAFERVTDGTSEMMLVAGFSGIGKTAIINEVHKPITRLKGYFIKGKFDQFNRNIPLSAFVQALRDLMGQLLSESDTQLQNWKDKILEAVGDNGQVLIEVIPELEQVIGKQLPTPELSGSAAQNRFNLLFQKFVQVFTHQEHPLVIFLDDWQWADSASLKLLQLLMNDTAHLLILGAYRDNEVSPIHPFILTVEALRQAGATVNTITLPPLTQSDINHLVADTLSCERNLAQPLTKLLYQKTQGNPFFCTQFLKALHQEHLIIFDSKLGYWQCNLSQIKAHSLTNDVVEFMAMQLQKLPAETQDVLKLAACIGAQFDLTTLAIVSERTEVEVAFDLWKALQEGLVLPLNQTYKFFQDETATQETGQSVNVVYQFLHDRVQQAAYFLIPENQKQATHLKMGQLLLEKTPKSTLKENIFEIVNHLNIGADLISETSQLEQLIGLNLIAGQKAKTATAYADAVRYLNISLGLLKAEDWQQNYDLTLSVHIEAADAEYLNTNFQRLEILAQIVLDQAKTLLDQIKVYELLIQSYQLQSLMLKAIEIGIEALEKLGICLSSSIHERPIPDLPSLEDLDRVPEMSDPHQLAALRILMAIYPPIYIAKPELIKPLILTMVHLSMEGGYSGLAAYGYVLYGMILCGENGEIEQGYHAGQIALKLLDKFDATPLKAKIYTLFNAHVRFWKEPAQSTLSGYLEGCQSGLETGDIEWASYNSMHYCKNLFWVGESLELAEQKQGSYLDLIQKNNHEFALSHARIWMQLILNLQGKAADLLQLSGTDFDESQFIPLWQSTNNYMSLFALYVAKANLCYLFEDVPAALDYVLQAQQYIKASLGLITVAVYNFYASLILLAAYPQAETSRQQQYLSIIQENQNNLREWSLHAPQNFQHKYQLVEAERARILGNIPDAIEYYDQAIQGAKENQYTQEEALANELAAKFYLTRGKEKVAAGYMQEAYYCYARWGSAAKTNHLEETYPQLLLPILQRCEPILYSTHSQISSPTIGVTTTTSVLDLASAIKASQALSEEIELEALLSKLMQIVLENAGADKGVLILNNADTWEVVAQCDNGICQLSTLLLDQSPNLPSTIIHTVKRTQQTLLINNLEQDKTFTADPYLIRQQPKSLFCTPIFNQGKLIGILYLENNLAARAFSQDRIKVLNLLTAQAAISIDNARLYSRLEDYSHNLEALVEQRTQELQEKNQHLQQTLQKLELTQVQLVQAEKMSGLGQLVAGIAHEINNPINFIAGNVNHAREYFHELFDLIELYQQHSPHPHAAIRDKLKKMDLEFLCDDLEKLLNSMQTGSDRIRQIILGLRNFSRLQESERKPVDIHEGLENTLLILQHRLKASGERPEIIIHKNYGNLPLVNCYASQLNQVFLNILTNAIDVLIASNASKCPEIRISTEMGKQQTVRVTISDNGPGMSENIRQRAFDPFFTTKPIGQGTGLGLSISYQIVTEQHKGQLHCISQLGKGTELIMEIPI